MSTTTPVPDDADQLAALVRCDQCGRYGWHETDRCPERPQSLDVALPAGASRSSTRSEWGNEFRIVYGPQRTVDGCDVDKVRVEACAFQVPGGSISDGTDLPGAAAPGISVQSHWGDPLTSSQARQLAAAILAAADEAGGWAVL